MKDGTLRKLLTALAADLQSRSKFDLSECFIDDSCPPKKGRWSRKDQAGQGYAAHGSGRWHWSSSRRLHNEWFAATLVRTEYRLIAEKPEKLISDKAYDSEPLDAELATLGIEVIAPHKRYRKKAKTQDGRKLLVRTRSGGASVTPTILMIISKLVLSDTNSAIISAN